MSYSSVTVPRMLFDLLTDRRDISVLACLTQIYFFFFFATSEVSMLAVMSYDRYVAICRPLHYMQIMSWKVCAWLVSGVLIFGVVYSLVHTLFLTRLTFGNSNILQSFFCDLPQLLEVSCSDTFINVLLIFLLGTLFGVVILAATFYPYIPIINTILKISEHMRSKSFSTRSSHLTVVFIFYATFLFNYYRPNAKSHFIEDKVASLFYATLIPFLNPLIYSLRNQELKSLIRRSLLSFFFASYEETLQRFQLENIWLADSLTSSEGFKVKKLRISKCFLGYFDHRMGYFDLRLRLRIEGFELKIV
ncbi:hypothetical protein XELAEV_18047925mg [Xenopus laevis]|uniref:Olfactory receptor n=1 Tax=Xenopus laevis TaxID=8355 RepID=A0A974H1W2_XENLA|nr:hypothetical protein XELAEV_18047925mg [Xenopus laevis]